MNLLCMRSAEFKGSRLQSKQEAKGAQEPAQQRAQIERDEVATRYEEWSWQEGPNTTHLAQIGVVYRRKSEEIVMVNSKGFATVEVATDNSGLLAGTSSDLSAIPDLDSSPLYQLATTKRCHTGIPLRTTSTLPSLSQLRCDLLSMFLDLCCSGLRCGTCSSELRMLVLEDERVTPVCLNSLLGSISHYERRGYHGFSAGRGVDPAGNAAGGYHGFSAGRGVDPAGNSSGGG
ncbi:hypothetical protein F511_23516 [Dorcoceras hygrometricum]|uniref:Uncharacterized protein n=1 Tax=Dorcoceras hygrometricum TaxID=472368 RepID=A0A2Z7D491_9LAMI|nr:hypothetical protein F511_23516 [Dorcoceras hygrometricum]